MKYEEIVEVVRCSWIDSSDVKDLVEILSANNAVGELKKIWSGDRIDHLYWLLNIIVNPSDGLKQQAANLLAEMGWNK
jgi:hypothetical protein